MEKLKKGLWTIGKYAGGLACVILGLSIGGFGVAQFLPQKQYSKCTLPDNRKEEDDRK